MQQLLGILIALGVLGYVFRSYVAYTFAYLNKHYGTGLLFTFVPQNEIVYIMKGDSLKRIIANIHGKALDVNDNLVDLPDGVEHDPTHSEFNKRYGVFFIGIPFINKPLRYMFQWDKWSKKQKESGYEIKPRNEEVTSLFFRYPYPILAKEIEISGNLQFNIQLLVTMEAVNPRKALFDTLPHGTWLQQVEASVIAAIRVWASKKSIDEIRNATTAQFASMIRKVNTGFKASNGEPHRSVIDFIGMKVVGVNLIEIEPSDSKVKETIQQRAVAEQQALAKKETAKGNAAAITIEADAEAGAIEKIGDAKTRVAKTLYAAATSVQGGSHMFIAEAARDAATGSKATVYAPGGSAGVMVSVPNTNQPPKNPPSAP